VRDEAFYAWRFVNPLSAYRFVFHAHDDGYDFAAVVAHARERFGVPVWTGLPFGHVRDKLTLPVGGRATLIAGDGAAELVLRDHA